MPTAVQLPYRRGQAQSLGRGLYRKPILPLGGSITYEGRPLNFTREYLSDLVDSFRAGAFDSVPFLLANEANEHHSDPEKFRGELKGLELTDQALEGIFELSGDGEKLISDNPRLGVSARIVPHLKRPDGRQFPLALEHVLGTLNPKVNGLGPWSPAELSQHDEAVVDLTGARFSDDDEKEAAMAELSDEAIQRLNGLSPEQWDRLVSGEAPSTNGNGNGAAPAGGDGGQADDYDTVYREMLVAEGIDPDDEAAIAALLAGEGAGEPAPAGAGLSAEQQAALELVSVQSQQTATDLSVVQAQLAQAKWQRDRDALIHQGIPPVAVDLAEPFLRAEGVVELSNGEHKGAPDQMRELLSLFTVLDFSAETASARPPDEDDHRDAVLHQWDREYPAAFARPYAGGNA